MADIAHKDLTGAELHEPKPHKATHENGGSDEMSVTGLTGLLATSQTAVQHPLDSSTLHSVPTDITTFDVSIAKHGLCPKAPNDITKFLRGDVTWSVPVAKLNFLATPVRLINWTAATAWTDVDITAYTGGLVAVAALLSVSLRYSPTVVGESCMAGYFRKNGSAEAAGWAALLPRIAGSASYSALIPSFVRTSGSFIIEVDAGEIFEVTLATEVGTSTSIIFYTDLIGFFTA